MVPNGPHRDALSHHPPGVWGNFRRGSWAAPINIHHHPWKNLKILWISMEKSMENHSVINQFPWFFPWKSLSNPSIFPCTSHFLPIFFSSHFSPVLLSSQDVHNSPRIADDEEVSIEVPGRGFTTVRKWDLTIIILHVNGHDKWKRYGKCMGHDNDSGIWSWTW
jgi:hypothetical protein